MPDLAADLELALALADEADVITTARFGAVDLVVETKPDRTPVTEADRAVELALRKRLAAERPGDALVGEEFGEEGASSRRWILDPIDGTKNYLRGVPIWATLIALEIDGRIDVGVVSAPELGRRWWARRGGGAFVNGAPIHVSGVTDLADAHLGYGDAERWAAAGFADRFEALAAQCWRARGLGDFWIHVLVAEGAFDLAVEPDLALWDLAPLLVIVEEAGGRFSDLGGDNRASGGSAISSNGRVHEAALAVLTPLET